MSLDIQTRTLPPDITVVSFIGKLNLNTEGGRVEPLVKGLLKKDQKKLIFDLAGLDYIDSAGIGLIAYSAAAAKNAGGALRVARAKDRVRQVFLAMRLSLIVPADATIEEAVTALGAP